MVRTQIQLEEEQSVALRRLAAARGVSMATLIREAVDRLLRTSERERVIERALAACGSVDSGQPGLAEDHDEEFATAVEERS